MTNPTRLTRIGALLPATLTTWIGVAEQDSPILPVLAVICGLYALGLVLMETGVRRTGARLVFVTCLLTVPMGIPGALGARGVLDELDRSPADR